MKATHARSDLAAQPADQREDDVLDALEARVAEHGIRSVVMSQLARDLGMSTKTLYRLFPSKEAMLMAMVERWSARLVAAQQRRMRSSMSAEERVRTAVRHLTAWRSKFADAFWVDLEFEHPDVWARYRQIVAESQDHSTAWMSTLVRADVDVVFARELLIASVRRALDPEVRSAAGLGRGEAIDAAVHIWAAGVFTDPTAVPPEPSRADQLG